MRNLRKKGQNSWYMIVERTLNKLEISTTEDVYDNDILSC